MCQFPSMFCHHQHLIRYNFGIFRYLTLAWDEANIRSQDYLTVLSHISDNPSGEALVWDDVRSRWTDLVDRFTLNSRYLGNLIPSITSNFNTEARLQEVCIHIYVAIFIGWFFLTLWVTRTNRPRAKKCSEILLLT